MNSWSNLTFFLVSGLCQGAIYALVALGYTMVYGVLRLINFAHGEFYMCGAYAAFGAYVLWLHQAPVWLALPALLLISALASAAIAVLTERVAYQPIRNSGRLAALLTAIGVSFLLQNLATFVRQGRPLMYVAEAGTLGTLCQSSVQVGFRGIKIVTLLNVPGTLLLTAGVWFMVQRTRFGRSMRAVSHDLEAARLLGIDVDAVIRKTFLLGGLLAGVAGTVVGMQGVIEPQMGFLVGLNAFIAAVVGGIGSVPGAVLGGFLIGVIQYLVLFSGVPSGYKDVASLLVLILVLVIRPQGILGQTQREKV